MSALPVWSHAVPPWHDGETQLQRRAGAYEALAEAGPRIVRSAMPQQHRDFFAQLPFVVAGAAGADGQPWASVLTGPPGFLSTPAEDRLHAAAGPTRGDPLHTLLAAGQPLALLGIELHTRRRNRANGRLLAVDTTGLQLQVLQSFGNCPQYIQLRELSPAPQQPVSGDLPVQRGHALEGRAARIVAAADTFFIATQALPDAVNGGADVSHRGGRPGFVRIDQGGSRITWPDFAGNRFFNTLGNISLQPRAGLLFIDFAQGALLHVAGRAQIVFDGPELDGFAGAQRLVQLEVSQWLLRPGAWPLRGALREFSPTLQRTGAWATAPAPA